MRSCQARRPSLRGPPWSTAPSAASRRPCFPSAQLAFRVDGRLCCVELHVSTESLLFLKVSTILFFQRKSSNLIFWIFAAIPIYCHSLMQIDWTWYIIKFLYRINACIIIYIISYIFIMGKDVLMCCGRIPQLCFYLLEFRQVFYFPPRRRYLEDSHALQGCVLQELCSSGNLYFSKETLPLSIACLPSRQCCKIRNMIIVDTVKIMICHCDDSFF